MRTPSPFLMSQSITLYNKLPNDGIPVNGSYENKFSRVILRSVRYAQCEGAVTASSHGAVSDSLRVIILPCQSVCGKGYCSPNQYEELHESCWTIQKGEDYIALGEYNDDKPSTNKEGSRNDFKVTSVDIRYKPDGTIHQFEVNAK